MKLKTLIICGILSYLWVCFVSLSLFRKILLLVILCNRTKEIKQKKKKDLINKRIFIKFLNPESTITNHLIYIYTFLYPNQISI